MMVAFAMVTLMVSCDKDKDKDDDNTATGTYIASATVTDAGTLSNGEVSVLNQTLQIALQDAKYENTKLEDAKSDLSTRLSPQAQGIAQSDGYSDKTFTVTVFLKDGAGNTKAQWVITCTNGSAQIS